MSLNWSKIDKKSSNLVRKQTFWSQYQVCSWSQYQVSKSADFRGKAKLSTKTERESIKFGNINTEIISSIFLWINENGSEPNQNLTGYTIIPNHDQLKISIFISH